MKAGNLDRLVVVQKKTEAKDVFGQMVTTWANFLTTWANPVHDVGTEKETDNNRNTDRKVNFRARYNSTITNQMRVVWNGGIYKIEDIKELGRRDGLIILTSLLAQT